MSQDPLCRIRSKRPILNRKPGALQALTNTFDVQLKEAAFCEPLHTKARIVCVTYNMSK